MAYRTLFSGFGDRSTIPAMFYDLWGTNFCQTITLVLPRYCRNSKEWCLFIFYILIICEFVRTIIKQLDCLAAIFPVRSNIQQH